MKRAPLSATLTALALAVVWPTFAAEKSSPAGQEEATRLQVFLDRAEFAPGKIDGHYGDFTRKALALYRESKGMPAAEGSATSVDTKGLDLASADPVFITYTVTDEDVSSVGPVPDSVPAQAKLKWLPYKNALEAIGEKFHTDVDFLAKLNPGKTKDIKAGDQLKVPNVEPFALDSVQELKPGSEMTQAVNDADDYSGGKDSKKDDGKPGDDASITTSVTVDTRTNMLSVYAGNKLIAAYPVTIGSAETESPIGDWTVRGIAKLPNFRYDKAMLEHGERSGDFHMLPPGPNDPVGVVWIALNKKGIGLHGTDDPDSIGRSASHGCVRLANWDVVRLAGKVKTGVPVSIH